VVYITHDVILLKPQDHERLSRTEAFSMIVKEELSTSKSWLDKDEYGRHRKWFSIPDAVQLLKDRNKLDKVEYFIKAHCPSITNDIITTNVSNSSDDDIIVKSDIALNTSGIITQSLGTTVCTS
jgi:diphosphoinositol-polyphosphate diphosphatase